ncbi:MAG: anthranilate phosphoribosyltransferase [Chloroflexi bacterium]|nr:anthranilate phosphoribosyltransferase [Chloroflexota bacterium]
MIVGAIQTVVEGRSLARDTAREVMEAILTGGVTPAQFGALVTALRLKGESADEIAGFLESMRAHATRVDLGDLPAVDACGTGGRGVSWFNVTTTAALVAAGAGAKVAKHGNRSFTRKSGSADAFEALGVRLAVTPAVVAQSVREAGIGFMFAQAFHPSMKFAAPLRREIGIRTMFNVLGPLTNPAGVRRQLLGVATPALAATMAAALQKMGAVRVLVVAGHGGMDEVTLDGPTQVTELRDGSIASYTVSAEDLGLAASEPGSVAGGTPDENAVTIRGILDGADRGPRRDLAIANAAGVLLAAGVADSWRDGVERAAAAIDDGAAAASLERMVAITNSTSGS